MSNSTNIANNLLWYCTNVTESTLLSSIQVSIRLCLYLPLSIPILFLAYQQWRRRRSFAATSNADLLVFHLAVTQLVAALGSCLYFFGYFTNRALWTIVGVYMGSIIFPGEVYFHILTCLDRYVAVVHPVVYLRMRRVGVVRGIAICCVWLLCVGWIGVLFLYYPDLPHIPFFCVLAFSLAIVSFCSLAVLCVLIRPGPGEVGGNRKQRADQSKRRAFHTVSSITTVLLVYFLVMVMTLTVDNLKVLTYHESCIMLTLINWVGLPTSLVLPLLFLHRAGKLPCCQGNREQTFK